MKKLTKGLFYYKPSKKERYIEQNLPADKIDEYLNDDLVMIWHECEKWSRRPGVNRVSLKHVKTEGDVSHYKCAICDFTYELDNNFELAVSR